MVNKKILLQLSVLLILAIFAVLLIWQPGSRKEIGHPASHKPDDTLAQSSVANSVTAETKDCKQQPIQVGDGDFTPVDNTLKCIVMAYTDAAGRKDKKRILALDTELEDLVKEVQSLKNYDAWDAFWQDKEVLKYQYQMAIGVYIEEEGMSYDGRLRNSIVQSPTKALPGLEQLKPQFDQIKAAFLAIPKAPEIANIEALYKLDEQLEKLVAEANAKFDRSTRLPNYPEIGVYWDGGINYTGTIRLIADKMLPPQGFVDPKTGKKIEVKGDRYSKLKKELEGVYLTYKSLKLVPENAEKLYELSEDLRKVVEEIHKAYPYSRSQIFWEDKYEPLGLYIGHYSDQLDYGEKLLVDSYRLNPDSRYGETTLVATISGAGNMSELNGIPDIGLVKLYLKKYPDGKYLRNVYAILATFYQNLYEELLASNETPSINDCYTNYLSAYPEDKVREVVRNKAMAYYKKLLAFEPAQEGYKKALNDLENRRDGNTRYWCTD